MNSLIHLLRGLIFLVIGGLIGGCSTWVGPIQKDSSIEKKALLSPQLVGNYLPLKNLPLENGYLAKSLYFLLDNEHIMVIQGYRGASFIDLKNGRTLHNYLLGLTQK